MPVASDCRMALREEQSGRQPVLLIVRRASGVEVFQMIWNGDKTLHDVLASDAVGAPPAGTMWSFVITGSSCPQLADTAVEPLRLDVAISDIAQYRAGRLVSLLLDVTLVASQEWTKYVAVVRDTLDSRPTGAWRTTVVTEHVHCFACIYHHLEELLELLDEAGSRAAAVDDFLVSSGVDPTIFACSVYSMLRVFDISLRQFPDISGHVRRRFLDHIRLNF